MKISIPLILASALGALGVASPALAQGYDYDNGPPPPYHRHYDRPPEYGSYHRYHHHDRYDHPDYRYRRRALPRQDYDETY